MVTKCYLNTKIRKEKEKKKHTGDGQTAVALEEVRLRGVSNWKGARRSGLGISKTFSCRLLVSR